MSSAIKSVQNIESVKDANGAITETYKVNVEIPTSTPTSGGIHTYDVESGSKDKSSCEATLKITYFINGTGEQIKITNIKGGWTPESNYLVISNRVAAVTDGRGIGIEKTLTKKPTSNSFNYDTGWGYVDYIGGSDKTGARGYTEATLSISGMGGTYDLFLPVAITGDAN